MNWEGGLDSAGLVKVQMLASVMDSLIPYNKWIPYLDEQL